MHASFNGKTSNNPRGSDYDFLNGVFEWVFYNLPARADNTFTRNMYEFYKTRGGLSKKQLEGLYQIAQKVNTIPVGKLSTLEAIILKKPNRYKSEKPAVTPLYKKDEELGKKIDTILEKYPQHKRVLFLKAKYENNEIFSSSEIADLEKFYKLLR